MLNAKKLNIASAVVSVGDIVSVRENSKSRKTFTSIAESLKTYKSPKFLELDTEKMSAKIVSVPVETEYSFDIDRVLEYYSR
jgi:small subunit ribosomal protein S4